jgi:hypothetical protein
LSSKSGNSPIIPISVVAIVKMVNSRLVLLNFIKEKKAANAKGAKTKGSFFRNST